MKKETFFKSLLAFLLLMVGANSSWADKTIYPAKERVDRTNNATPTGWQSGFPKDATTGSNTECEVKNLDARIWVLEQYVIPNIDYVKSVTLTYTRVSGQSNNGPLAIWGFNYDYPTDNTFSTAADSYLDHVKTVLGVYPGNAITNNPDFETTGSTTRTVTITGEGLTTLKSKGTITDGTLTVNLLLTTKEGTTNYKYYSVNSSNSEANRPHMTVSYYVHNATTSTNYDDWSSAISALSDADNEIELYDDLVLSSGLSWTKSHVLTITPKTNLTITGPSNSRWFTAKDANTTNTGCNLIIGGSDYAITLDGNNETRTADFSLRANKSNIYFKNVVFKNIDLNNTKDLCVGENADGDIIFEDVTLSNCKNPAHGFIYNQRVTNDRIVLKGYLNIDTDCTGTGIYATVEYKASPEAINGRIKVDDADFTVSNPIKVNWVSKDANNVLREGFTVVEGNNTPANFTLVNEGWTLKAGDSGTKLVLAGSYDITLATGIEHGAVEVDKTKAASGETVTLTPTPAAGFKLSAWNVYKTDDTSTTVEVTNNTFTMPAYAVTVSATFVEKAAVSIGETEYTTLEAAVTATDADATIMINKDVTVTSAISFDKNLTIKPAVADVKILRSTELGNNALFTMGANVTVAIGDAETALIIDGQSTEFAGQLISVPEDKGTLNLVNTTIQNVSSTDSKGVIFAKKKSSGTGSVNLKNVTFSNCKATAENAGIIFSGATESVVLQGANTFSSCVGNNFYLEGRILVDNNLTTPSTPYTVYALLSKFTNSGIVNGAVVKYSNTSYYGENHFAIVNPGYEYELNNTTTPTELKLKATPYAVSAATGITGGSVEFSKNGTDYSASLTDATVGATIYIKVTPTGDNFLSGLPTATYGATPTALEVAATTTDGVYTFTMPAAAVTTGATFITPAAGNVWNQTQNTGHATLADAVTNAAANDIIIIRANTTETATITFDKSLTIKPAAADLSIKRSAEMTGENDKVLFSMDTEGVIVTIGDATNTLNIDGQSTASTKALVEVKNGSLNFVNVTVKDMVTSNTQGVLCAKNSGTIVLDGITFNGCQATAENAGVVFSGKNDGIQLQGTNTFTSCTGYDFCIERRLRVAAEITTPATPYGVYIKPKSDGIPNISVDAPVVVYKTVSHFAAGQFEVKNAGYKLADALSNKDLNLQKIDYIVTLSPSDGTVATDLEDLTKAHIGDVVTVTLTVPTGKQLETLTVKDADENVIETTTVSEGTKYTFTMPAANVTITATLVDFVSYIHPIMLHKQADIDRVKQNLGLSPVKDAWNHLQESSYASTSYTANPVEYLKRMDAGNWSGTYPDYNNYTNAMKDAAAAYQLALRYQLSGDESYAAKAAEILDAWATTNKGVIKRTGESYVNDIPDPNEYLILIQGHQFANAAELLNGYSWEGKTAFVGWMKTTFYDLAHAFLTTHHANEQTYPRHYWMNWDLAAMTAVLSYGILADDQTKVAEALNYYTTSSAYNGYMGNAIGTLNTVDGKEIAQCQESGRDQGHTMLDVALLGAFCQMATNVSGVDYFAKSAEGKGNAMQMAEYVAKYNLKEGEGFKYEDNTDNFPFTEMTYQYDASTTVDHTKNSADSRGEVRPVWELFYRYAQQNGKDATYTEQWVNLLRAENAWGEGGAGDYGTTSTGFDQLGYGTLMYADPTSADGQDEKFDETEYADFTISKRAAQGDTYVRSDNADSKDGGKAVQMEIRTNSSAEFDGFISFRLPAAAVGKVKRAQLQLVTKRKKNHSNIDIYQFEDFDEAAANYTTKGEAIATAKSTAKLATFTPKGQYDMDVTSDATKATFMDDYKNLEAWQNRIDLTDYVKNLTDRNVNLLLADVGTDDANPIQFFTREWSTALTTEKSGFEAKADTLHPRLVVIYEGTVVEKTFMVDEDGYDTLDEALEAVADGGTIIVTANATLEARTVGESETARISITKNVTIKGKTGNEVVSRGSSDIAMKQNVMFNANSGKTVTFENFIYDDNGATVGQVFEVYNDHFILKDMTIQNSKSTATNGVVHMRSGSLTLNGVTFKDSEISTAFVHLGGGTLKEASITLENSTGDHFRLGAIEIDDTKIADGTYRIEVEDATAKIINVTDENKYELTSIGYIKNYSDNTITFTEESDGQDTDAMEVPDGAVKESVSCMGDTYVRKGNTADNGKKPNMEVYTYESSEEDVDFVGLMGFKLPDDLLKEGAELHKAQLRLVTKRLKGSRIIDMYAFYRDFEESTTYDKMESQINDMRSGDKLHRFHARGESNMDIVADSLKLSEEYLDISKWTNLIDLTELVGEAMYDDGKIRIALMSPINSKDPKMFYTKEADSIKNERMDIKDIYLVPKLTLIYTPGTGGSTISAKDVEATPNADTFLRKGSNSDNSVSTCIEVYSYKSAKDDIDLVGLLSFALNEEAQSARRRAQANELELFNATLRLVTKRVRGERDMNVYVFDKPFSGTSTYAEMESAITETRENGKYATFKTAGQADKDITTDSGLTGDYKTSIAAWTNEIDLTEMLKGSDTNTVRLMLSAPNNGRSSKQYFSSEADSFTNDNNKDFIVAAEDLVPQLVITYRGQGTTAIEEVITIPVIESQEIYDLRGNRVKTMGKGVYIINGKKVLMK